MYSEQYKLCELLLLTCNACLIFLARLPALLSVIKKSGKNLQILRPIFRSFWSQWLACFGWMASQTQMCLTGICQGTILDTRQKCQAGAGELFGKFQILTFELNSRYHQSPLCWKISTLYSLLSKSHKKSLHTVYTLYPYTWIQSHAHNMPFWRGSRLIDFTSGEVFSIVCAAQ